MMVVSEAMNAARHSRKCTMATTISAALASAPLIAGEGAEALELIIVELWSTPDLAAQVGNFSRPDDLLSDIWPPEDEAAIAKAIGRASDTAVKAAE